MDFFQQQDRARKRSFWLLVLFGLAVLLVVASVTSLVYFFVGDALLHPKTPQEYQNAVVTLVGTAAVVLLIILGGSVFRSIQLRSGGGRGVAEMLGGRLVNPHTLNLKERRLLNVVEEMALASGVPVPQVFILDNESGINAMAAGFSPEQAVIAVTRGTLDSLNRDELQGVLGHEFSHILNGDMRMSVRMMGVLYGLLLIYFIGLFVFRSTLYSVSPISANSSSDDGDDDGGANNGSARLLILLISLAVMFIGCVGVFLGKLIKASISRQREYLADASSVQFTRNPSSLASVLKKIAVLPNSVQKFHTPNAPEASHLFFAELPTNLLASFLATHPPIIKRIQRLEPTFDSTQLSKMSEAFSASTFNAANTANAENVAPASSTMEMLGASAFTGNTLEHVSAAASASFAEPEPRSPLLPLSPLREAISNALGASAYTLAILTDPTNPELQAIQLQTVQNLLDGILVFDYKQLLEQVRTLPPGERLRNLQLAIPALKQLSIEQYRVIRSGIRALIEADQMVDLNEFVIYAMVCRQLDIEFGLRSPVTSVFSTISHLTGTHLSAAVQILSRLALAGTSDVEAQKTAFARGIEKLTLSGTSLQVEQLPLEECTNQNFQKALTLLDALHLTLKRRFLDACAAVIDADGVETDEETVLRFGIAASLGIY